ncbi:MAG: NAD(+) synthase [Spirochaetes bacterium]|nr:NAD(+) synthase [Spirochaetota bacterium]
MPFSSIGGVSQNCEIIAGQINEASDNGASIVVFPEMSVSGYTCNDLFQHETIISKCEEGLSGILSSTRKLPILAMVGLPVINGSNLYNCACVINMGRILGIVPKSFIPGYREFYEPRWFSGSRSDYMPEIELCGQRVPFGTRILFCDENERNHAVAVEICEDLWVPVPPSCGHALAGATVICNLSASNALIAKHEYRRDLVNAQSARCICGYVYCSSGTGESTTDVVFDGDAAIAENGTVLAESERFLRKSQVIYSEIDVDRLAGERIKMNSFEGTGSGYVRTGFTGQGKSFSLTRVIDPMPFVPKDRDRLDERCGEIFRIQASGLARRLESVPGARPVIGVSGGLDSTLALLVSIRALGMLDRLQSDIIAVTMPGFGTTEGTYKNATLLCKNLGIDLREVDIKNLSGEVFTACGIDDKNHDVTYENVQARARTYVLMTIANRSNGLVIGTGDLSEIALGWNTYNGDHMSMYNVNSGIPKTLVKFLIKRVAEHEFEGDAAKILSGIAEQPITPELLPPDGKNISQKTEEIIGPYRLHDFFLYYFVRFGFSPDKIFFLSKAAFRVEYDEKTLKRWLAVFLERFFKNQWKRDCVPAGVKVGSIDLSPRGSWRMPAEASLRDYLDILERA